MPKIFYKENEILFLEISQNGNFKNLTGQSYNRLEVLGLASLLRSGSLWFCRCECGNITKVHGSKLINSRTKSCGCLMIEKIVERFTTHGHTKAGKVSAEYTIWSSMLSRTQNPKDRCFHRYGGRGIKVCERWLVFENFLADMGKRPEGLTLERKENDKGYFDENCRWATPKEQANNTRRNRQITYNGKTQNLGQWANEIGVDRRTIAMRLKLRWPVEKALTTPSKQYQKKQ